MLGRTALENFKQYFPLLIQYFFSVDFAEALANPIQFLSEEEKRGQQLEALMMDEEAAPQESTPVSHFS